jgi:hypothetical protein
MNAEYGQHGRRACIYAVQADGRVSEPVKYDHDAKASASTVMANLEKANHDPAVVGGPGDDGPPGWDRQKSSSKAATT